MKSMFTTMLLLIVAMFAFSLGVTLAQATEAVATASPISTATSPVVVEVPASSGANIPYALLVIAVFALVAATLGNALLAHQSSKSAASNVPLKDAVAVLDKGIELAARLLAPSIYRSSATWDDDLFETVLSLRGYTLTKRADGVIEIYRKQDSPIVDTGQPADTR